MYARTVQRPKQRRSQLKKWNAPTLGWISNTNLADPSQLQGQGAAVLDNFFPRSSTVELRRGKQLYATLGSGALDASSLFSYNNGQNKKLFGATPTTIYDITNVLLPDNVDIVTEDGDLIETDTGDTIGWSSTDGLDVMGGFTGGKWIVVQFATTGGVFLIGVNGEDDGFIFDGTNFYPYVEGGVYVVQYDNLTVDFTVGSVLTGGTSGATGTIYKVVADTATTGELWLTGFTGTPFTDNELITDGDGGSADADGVGSLAVPGITFAPGITTADMSFVWVYQSRLWFAQKDTMVAWYADAVDSIGGTFSPFSLEGVFGRGGALFFGQTWSLEGGLEGGLSEQNIFVSTEGEVAVYQGSFPEEPTTWGKVGIYRIGRPLGNRGFVRGGGDLAVATSVGLIPLSKAIGLDFTSLNVAAVSYNIADAWSDATQNRGLVDWQAEIWPEQKLAAFAPPNLIGGDEPVVFVSNTETGAWGRYTNWNVLCMEVFNGQLYFGSPSGQVFEANVSGFDDGLAYTGVVMPLFEDMGSPASAKIAKVGRAVGRSNSDFLDLITFHSDFNMTLPPPPDSTPSGSPNVWGTGIWGQASWGTIGTPLVDQEWRSIGGIGYACAVSFQVTSGNAAPLDVELIRIEVLYDTAEMVS